jgi:uncharacterized protein YuzE
MQITMNEDGVLLIQFQPGVKAASTKEPMPEVFVDLDAVGEVISIEVVGAEEVSAADLARVFQKYGLDERLVLQKAS